MKRKFNTKLIAMIAIALVLVMTMSIIAFAEGEDASEYTSRFHSTIF